MWNWLWFLAGALVGGTFGLVVTCAIVSNRDFKDEMDETYRKG